ncbi:Eco57I restriction-modification methylase domain-containing protein [Methanoplanus endosymbiosus]|uniref:site-specific DNA-methyltransferase (adenine-specific) n=1 Tax=Methanoplanus endosymbiosus TaxID=33865 RepID=A0A9E7TH06_9EURY|nr:Eco57I restriction-modification methylase domain-containing protein [Methanoplanus endosymbiosus]UUX91992.1 Eco57I restriction-modification methylase domain-containing protein [Methanoplanus endosymbiosus]
MSSLNSPAENLTDSGLSVPDDNQDSFSLIDLAIDLSLKHSAGISIDERKKIGQIFTPKETAMFMAGFVNINPGKSNISGCDNNSGMAEFSLMDPGSGTGNLLSAVCQRILNEAYSPMNIRVDAFECDTLVIPSLKQVLDSCRNSLEAEGHRFQFNIIDEDFILHNEQYLEKGSLFREENLFYYDAVISNPPYYKINKQSSQAAIMKDFLSGQPNIYGLFMALSAHMVKDSGDIIFVTPRSFCSGLYYRKVRNWFIKNTCIHWIHNFESRKNRFLNDSILQENVIVHAVKTKAEMCHSSLISSSYDNLFTDVHQIAVPYKDLIFNRDDENIIRIPTSETELKIIELVDSWKYTLSDFGLRMSTGPVVDFRTKENLRENYSEGKDAPLLWMQNLQGEEIIWPVEGLKKPQAIEVNPTTDSILLPVKNYVLIKRFTSKEQKRRLSATSLLKEDFSNYGMIGFENHLNYIHRPKGSLSEDETFGLTAFLNTKLIDLYFRAMNGNTQVNASEINILPIPEISFITDIGSKFRELKEISLANPDEIVGNILGIDNDLIKSLKYRS